MKSYNWTNTLLELYNKAVELYQAGDRDIRNYFDARELAAISSMGLRPINIYDHAEDFVKYGEPPWETFLLTASARRDYFIHKMGSAWSVPVILEKDLPAKTDSLDGIEWLPRIVMKAKCYLEGSLCEEIMYGCGGDRNFLKKFDIHAADFLRIVWAEKGDPKKVLRHLSLA